MPKLKNVTAEELDALSVGADSDTQVAYDYLNRMEQGYCEKIGSPIALATAFLRASQAMASLAAMILTKAQLQEQRAELEAELRKSAAGQMRGEENTGD